MKNIPEEKKFDVIFACIPQVPCLKEFAANTQEISNYFNPDDYKNYYNDNLAMLTHLSNRGLVLNDVLLQQSRQRLKEGGKVVLNLAGRAGESDINTIFERNGFHKKQILHSEVIQQHPQTSIENFANTEEALHQNFCFYSDSEGKEPIGAQLAHELMLKNKPVYHKIYAISAELDN
ncbi:MAG: hypothetical protein A3J96_00245 [Sulfurimonas sp. RIFOXYC2_FULL_36_7]|nr:MAG: hypothetical protein A3J96_00245 [Sulfurimonas sp. RIFOXYC2_FULL_36_7]